MKKQRSLFTSVFFVLICLLSLSLSGSPAGAAAPSGTVNTVIDVNNTETWTTNFSFGSGSVRVWGDLTVNGSSIQYSGGTSGEPLFVVKSGATLYLRNTTMSMDMMGSRIAVKVETGGRLVFDSSIFQNAAGKNPEALLSADGGTIEVKNSSEIRHNSNSNENGNIIRVINGNLIFSGSKFGSNFGTTGKNTGIKGLIGIRESEITIEDSTFEQNDNVYTGVFFAENTENFTINGSSFLSNYTQNTESSFESNGGTVFFLRNSTLNIGDNNRFEGNNSNYCEGGVLNAVSSKVFIGNNNSISKNTKAFFTLYSQMEIGNGNHFSENSEYVMLVPNSTIVIGKNNEFLKNSGHTLSCQASQVTIEAGNLFKENVSARDGGAIYFNVGSLTIKENNRFEKNSAAEKGGAIRVLFGGLNISGAVFEENTAKEGAAIYYQGHDTPVDMNKLIISGSEFNDNTSATGLGNTIMIENIVPEAMITGSEFINSEDGYTALIEIFKSSFVSEDKTNLIIGDRCISKNGHIHSENANMVLEGNVTVENGYGISMYSGRMEIGDDVVFRNNSKENGGAVGAFSSEVVIGKALFEKNSAYTGGAIFQGSGTLTLNGTRFVGNSAVDAGAIYVSAWNESLGEDDFTENAMVLNITDAVFEENEDSQYSGAILLDYFYRPSDRIQLVKGVITAHIHSASFINNRTGGSADVGRPRHASALSIGINSRVYVDDLAVSENGNVGIYCGNNSETFIYPRNGGVLYGNTGLKAPDGRADICLAPAEDVPEGEKAAVFFAADKMFNGGYFNWKKDASGNFWTAEPSDRNIFDARVLMKGNEVHPEDIDNGGAFVIVNYGQLFVGEPGTSFSGEIRWEYPEGYSEEPPAPEDFIPELVISRSGGDFDPGRIYQASHTTDEDANDLYVFRAEGDRSLEIRVTDRHDGKYSFEIADLPEFDDFLLNVNAIPKYDTVVSGSMAEGFTIVNRFREDAVPTPTPTPTLTPEPTATPEVYSIDMFRLIGQMEKLPETGFSTTPEAVDKE